MNWQSIDLQVVCQVHQDIIKRSHTQASIRDVALLHSAPERPKATFEEKDLYPTLFGKAAALLESLCLNHPFTDGNKRLAYSITHMFLWDNNFHLNPTTKDGVKFMLNISKKEIHVVEIAEWLKKHSSPRTGI